MPVSISDIEVDIQGLKNQQDEKRVHVRALRKGIKTLKTEQAELKKLITKKAPEYDLKALKANVQRIAKQIVNIEAVISKENVGMDQLKMMANVLENRIKRMTGDL